MQYTAASTEHQSLLLLHWCGGQCVPRGRLKVDVPQMHAATNCHGARHSCILLCGDCRLIVPHWCGHCRGPSFYGAVTRKTGHSHHTGASLHSLKPRCAAQKCPSWQGAEVGHGDRCTFDSNSYTEYESRALRTISRIVGNSVFSTCIISLIQIHNPNSDVFQV